MASRIGLQTNEFLNRPGNIDKDKAHTAEDQVYYRKNTFKYQDTQLWTVIEVKIGWWQDVQASYSSSLALRSSKMLTSSITLSYSSFTNHFSLSFLISSSKRPNFQSQTFLFFQLFLGAHQHSLGIIKNCRFHHP